MTHLLSTYELGRLHDEEMTDEERLELEEAEAVCRRFLEWDLKAEAERDDDRVMEKLGYVLGRHSDQVDNGGDKPT